MLGAEYELGRNKNATGAGVGTRSRRIGDRGGRFATIVRRRVGIGTPVKSSVANDCSSMPADCLLSDSLVRVPPLFTCPFEPEPAHAGRSARFTSPLRPPFSICSAPFGDCRPLPKPCGPRPRSVVLPCASQVRLPDRGGDWADWCAAKSVYGAVVDCVSAKCAVRVRLPTPPFAEGGRLRDSSF